VTTGQTLYAELKAVDAIAQVMRRTGCAWDFAAAKRLEGEYSEKLEKAAAQLTRVADGFGVKGFNPGSHKQVAELYQKTFKVEPVKYGKPNKAGVASPSYDEEALTLYFASDNPACSEFSRKLVEWRGYEKMLGTYIRGMAPEPGQVRVYGEWKAHGTVSGRWSCTGVPLQTLGATQRQLIKASPGKYIVEADLAQAELRSITLYSGEESLLQTFASGGDAYSVIGQRMFKSPEIKKGHKLRDLSKETSLASNYGAGPDTAFAQIWASEKIREKFEHLSVREVVAMQNKYFSAFPRLKAWGYEEEEACRKRGFYLDPFSGRRIKFFGPPNPNLARNFPNQACIAWWMNRATLRVWAELKPCDTLLTVVHDALAVETPEPNRVQELLHRHMGGTLTYQGRSIEMPVESKISSLEGSYSETK
jgi:DNA polymerase I-like protein with 3'-5' exonuclease and polymerase domains